VRDKSSAAKILSDRAQSPLYSVNMTDWNGVARARIPDLPLESAAAAATVLGSLESAFRPLLQQLPDDMEPALILSPAAVLGE
jgi:hypothetical protein